MPIYLSRLKLAAAVALMALPASANMMQMKTVLGPPACTNMVVQGQASTNTAILVTAASANSAVVITCG
jgi:hypothetical protein